MVIMTTTPAPPHTHTHPPRSPATLLLVVLTILTPTRTHMAVSIMVMHHVVMAMAGAVRGECCGWLCERWGGRVIGLRGKSDTLTRLMPSRLEWIECVRPGRFV